MNDRSRRSVLAGAASLVALPGCSALDPDPELNPPDAEWRVEERRTEVNADWGTFDREIVQFVVDDDSAITFDDGEEFRYSYEGGELHHPHFFSVGGEWDFPDYSLRLVQGDSVIVTATGEETIEAGERFRLHWYDEDQEASAVLVDHELQNL